MDLIFVVLILLLVGALFAGFGIWKLYHMAWPEERETRGRVQGADGEDGG